MDQVLICKVYQILFRRFNYKSLYDFTDLLKIYLRRATRRLEKFLRYQERTLPGIFNQILQLTIKIHLLMSLCLEYLIDILILKDNYFSLRHRIF